MKEKVQYFKDKNNKSRKNYEKYKTITTIIKSIDTFVNIATTSSSITLSLLGIDLIAIPISTATAFALPIFNDVLNEIIINKNIKHKKQYEKNQQIIESFENLYRNSLQDNVINISEYESLYNILTKYVDGKNLFFHEYYLKKK